MPVYTSHIPSLLNGVSRQAAQLRLGSQGEEMVNGYPTLQKGLGKRPPLKYIKNLGNIPSGDAATYHWINRDSTERYVVKLINGDLQVFDLAGNEKTVAFPDGKAYLNVTDPHADLAVVTVADYSFIVNKTKTVAMDAAQVSPALPYEAIINVMAGNYSRTYRVLIDGQEACKLVTADGSNRIHAPTIDPINIAKQIEYLLKNTQIGNVNDLPIAITGQEGNGDNWGSSQANGSSFMAAAPWTVTRYGAALHIQNATTDFDISVEDGYNGLAMKAIKGAHRRYTDLPPYGPDGFRVRITGDDINDLDDFWVEFHDGTNEGEGVWKECVAPVIKTHLDASTMPHVLVRETDGTFTFKRATWDPRDVGDEDTCPDPAFVGQKISDVAFFRNRLVMTAGENITMSRAGEYFNFFIETVSTALDTDPIDIGLSTDTVATIRHAVVLSNDLLLFSDQRQLRLTGGDLLTPSSAAIRDLTSYLCESAVAPKVVGEKAYFVKNFGQSSSIREFWVDQQTQNSENLEITNHCPEYIPGGVVDMAGSSSLSTLFVLTSTEPRRIYNHHFHWTQDGNKPQSAWGHWELPTGHHVLACEFFDTDLYVLTKYDSEYHLLKAPMEVGVSDTNQDWLTYLDYRVHRDDLELAPVYDSGTDTTSFAMPYTPPQDIEVWTAPGGTEYGPGSMLEVLDVTGHIVTVDGDLTAQPFYVGIPYTFRWRFSQYFMKDSKDGNPMVDGRSQIMRMKVWYGQTAAFTIDVTPFNKNKYTYGYSAIGTINDDPLTTYNDVIPQNGSYSFPVKCENDRVWVDIINDTALPSWFISAEFRVLFQPRYRRV